MMLGSNINKKYQNTSLLLTEQVCQRMLLKPYCCCHLFIDVLFVHSCSFSR